MWARSDCGSRAGDALGKSQVLAGIRIEESLEPPHNPQHCYDDTGEWEQEIGVGCEPVVVRMIEIIVVENSPASVSIPEGGWKHLDGVGRNEVEPDEEENQPEDCPHVCMHGQLTEYRSLSLLRPADDHHRCRSYCPSSNRSNLFPSQSAR